MVKKKEERPLILYIDDDHDNLVSFKFQFKEFYHIFLAHSAEEGYQILKKEDIQVVISDQRMPEKTGTEFFHQIVDEYPYMVRVILTGYSDYDAVLEAINKAKVYYYLQKPWQEEEIKLVIKNALESISLTKKNHDLILDLEEKNQILQEREAEKSKILNSIVSGLYIYDSTIQQNSFINNAYTRITGWSLEDIQGMGEKFFDLFHPDDLEDVQNHMKNIQEDIKNKSYSIVYRFKTKKNKWIWIESYDTPFLRNTEGRVIQYIGSFHDIGAKIMAEDALKEHRDHLEELVNERTKALESTNKELLERSEELENFNKVMLDRELRIIEMKEEVNLLCQKLGLEIKYPPVWGDTKR